MKQELHMMRKEAKAANEKVAEAMEQLSAKLDVLTELRNRAAGAVWLGLILVGAGVVGWIANAWHWWNQQGT